MDGSDIVLEAPDAILQNGKHESLFRVQLGFPAQAVEVLRGESCVGLKQRCDLFVEDRIASRAIFFFLIACISEFHILSPVLIGAAMASFVTRADKSPLVEKVFFIRTGRR
jgi:hypothetical protein